MTPHYKRETLGSRLGFLLLSAGCAIGLGNIWRFPYLCGTGGGAYFILMYLIFLVILGYPVMVFELAVGRAGRQSLGASMKRLELPGAKWHIPGYIATVGNLILLMFYTVVTGWLLFYSWNFLQALCPSRILTASQPIALDGVAPVFGELLGNWRLQTCFMLIAVAVAMAVCAAGLQKGVEKVTKSLMVGLFLLMLWLVVTACMLPNAKEGLQFMFQPNTDRLMEIGFWKTMHLAMTQAFFTLSLGVGSLAIFGSYCDRQKSLAGESDIIVALDTFVAICAGLIIFPSCFAFDVQPDAGPSLIFITLPRVFLTMRNGMFFGTVFFLFISIAAMTTLIAVMENIMAICMETWNWSRRHTAWLVGAALAVLSMPCVLGFNLWQRFQPFGEGSNILDLEDFIVSDNILPLGSVLVVLFCTWPKGWGPEKSYREANAGGGLRFPKWTLWYCKWVLPLVIFAIWLIGVLRKFHWLEF